VNVPSEKLVCMCKSANFMTYWLPYRVTREEYH
jgi:hypothetical protein